MATAAPQLECRRTLPLTSLNTSATALVARLLADKATSYKVAERQHQRRRLPLHLRLEVQPRRRRPAYQARARSTTSPPTRGPPVQLCRRRWLGLAAPCTKGNCTYSEARTHSPQRLLPRKSTTQSLTPGAPGRI